MINIILSIVSANLKNNEKYILSIDQNKIIFPKFTPNNYKNLQKNIITFIKTIFINDKYIDNYEDRVQLLAINNDILNNLFDNNNINILYGLTLPPLDTHDGYFWKTFNFIDTNIPNELSIIGDTIKYGL
jgi:hypothetical protein